MLSKKNLRRVILLLAGSLLLGLTLYVLIFSTQRGFVLFIEPLNRFVHQVGQSGDKMDGSSFSYEIYTKDEFCKHYFGESCLNDDDLKKRLDKKYPANWVRQGVLVYNHNYQDHKTSELDRTNQTKKCLNKLFGINTYTDFVYVTNRWVYISNLGK